MADSLDREATKDEVLSISPEKVCFIAIKAAALDAKDVLTDPDDGSNPSDDRMVKVLEDHPEDPVGRELISFIDALVIDEKIDLVALARLGRGDGSATDWDALRAEAARTYNGRTAHYLLGLPLLPSYLLDGLAQLGYSCEEFEGEHL